MEMLIFEIVGSTVLSKLVVAFFPLFHVVVSLVQSQLLAGGQTRRGKRQTNMKWYGQRRRRRWMSESECISFTTVDNVHH